MSEVQSTDRLADLAPETRALVEQVEREMPTQSTPEFTRIRENLFQVQVCTSLTDEEAAERVNRVPSGTSFGWVLATDRGLAPVPCDDNPQTHRHLIFEA